MIWFLLFMAAWLFCGWLGTAFAWTWFKKVFGSYDTEYYMGLMMMLGGPVNLFSGFYLFSNYGFKYWRE